MADILGVLLPRLSLRELKKKGRTDSPAGQSNQLVLTLCEGRLRPADPRICPSELSVLLKKSSHQTCTVCWIHMFQDLEYKRFPGMIFLYRQAYAEGQPQLVQCVPFQIMMSL